MMHYFIGICLVLLILETIIFYMDIIYYIA